MAQTAKHVIRQGIREAERGKILREFQDKNQELLSAKVSRIDPTTGNVTLEIGKNEALLPKSEQVPGETYTVGQTTKIFVVDVKEGTKGPKIMISRTHPGLKFLTAQSKSNQSPVRQAPEQKSPCFQRTRMLTR